MKITAIDTYIAGNPWKNWLFAKVSTDEGIYGIGEGTLNYFGKTIETAIHELTPLVLGMDPFQVEIISQRLIRDVYSEGAQIHMCAVAAIEIACWDIIGKACNQPVYNLWGGRCHEKLRAYANGWYRGPRTPESFAEKAKQVAGRGYTALKFDPFGNAWRNLSRYDFDLSVDIIRAVRDAVGDSVDLLIEGHCRFNVATAVEFAEAMHQFRPAWFEEPVPHTNITRHGRGGAAQPGSDRHRREPFHQAAVRRVAEARRGQHPAAGAAESGRPVRRAQDLPTWSTRTSA